MKYIETENLKNSISTKPQVYRYVPIYRLVEIFETKKFPLMKLNMWEDPFEGYLFKRWKELNQKPEFINLDSTLFSVCLSREMEKDLFWRSYTPDKNGVRIKIDIKKFAESLNDNYLLGEVSYKNIKDIKTIISNLENNTQEISKDDLLKLFLYKRLAFKYDKEIRLITIDSNCAQNVLKISFDPYEMITDIMFDPRMNEYSYNLYEDVIKNKYKFNKRVHKSKLYNPEEQFK